MSSILVLHARYQGKTKQPIPAWLKGFIEVSPVLGACAACALPRDNQATDTDMAQSIIEVSHVLSAQPSNRYQHGSELY